LSGQLIFGAAYIASTLLVVRDAVDRHASVGDVVLVVSLAAHVNQQVTGALTLLRELQRLGETLVELDWLRELLRPRARLARLRRRP